MERARAYPKDRSRSPEHSTRWLLFALLAVAVVATVCVVSRIASVAHSDNRTPRRGRSSQEAAFPR